MAISTNILKGAALTKKSVETKIGYYEDLKEVYSSQYTEQKRINNIIQDLQKREDRLLKEVFNGMSREELKKNFYSLKTSNTGLERLSEEGIRDLVFLYENRDNATLLKDNERFLK